MRNEPERIKNDQVEETREEYKYRRNMMKFAQKKRNRLMWNSSDMGTYKKQTVQQVEEKYKELKKDDKMEEALLKMDENLQKENLQKEA